MGDLVYMRPEQTSGELLESLVLKRMALEMSMVEGALQAPDVARVWFEDEYTIVESDGLGAVTVTGKAFQMTAVYTRSVADRVAALMSEAARLRGESL